MKSTFKRNLLIGFGVSLLLVIVSSIASYTSIRNLLNSEAQVSHTNKVISQLENVISTLKDAETGQRGFLLTNQDNFLQPYFGSREKAASLVGSLKKLTSDNLSQQNDLEKLEDVINNRMNVLQQLIDKRKSGVAILNTDLEIGKIYMDSARAIVNSLEERENALLHERTARMKTFTSSTPVLIVTAALLSLLITIFFFLRVNNDFENKVRLQRELEEKDKDMQRRITAIQSIAGKISQGDYKIRVNDDVKDVLGELTGSLNTMAETLDGSFTLLSDKERLQTGIAGMNEKLLGEQDVNELTVIIAQAAAEFTGSNTAAFYLVNSNGNLEYSAGYAFDIGDGRRRVIKRGEGLAGQAYSSGKIITLHEINGNDILISFATGKVKPKSVIAVPVYFERKVKGVLELASINVYDKNAIAFLENISDNIGIVLNTAENRRRLKELLEETQAQAEELQSQHSELENLNAELEAQAEKLQTSEEELKVQQEELLQANSELQENARSLEEKNQLISERNIEIQKKAEELAISTKYKSEFLANMSHELRTPLNSILLLARLLSENTDNNLSADQVEYATVIRNSGNSLLSLIDEILDLSRIESGKLNVEYGPVTIKEIVSDLKSLFVPLFKDKNLELRFETDDNVQEAIETDRMRIGQVLKNLLSNALKFTSKGYVQLRISASRDKKFVSFAVKDTGIGIPADKQLLIFEAFQQADGSTRRKYGGTGLGLSISRELARLLGGKIEVTSKPNEGSEFIITIPVSQSIARENAAAKNQEIISPGVRKEEIQLQPFDKYTTVLIPENIPDDRASIGEDDNVILIIDDDVNFAKSLLDFTRKKGYKGVVAVRGDEGIQLAKQLRPAGILLDIQLPVKSGWDVIEALKSSPYTRHIPVHMMSVYEAKNESMMKGAVNFINKPVAFENIQEIFKKIEYVLYHNPKKVLIAEDNAMHAKALAFFLENAGVVTEVKHTVEESIESLQDKKIDCVILDMGVPDSKAYDMLDNVRKTAGLEDVPIIIFTGKSLSQAEEMRIKQYADSIVIKTAHSYRRLLDEVSLFLHLVEDDKNAAGKSALSKTVVLKDVLKGKTVLIADDDARNIFSLTKALEQVQMNVVTAIDGKEALKKLESHPETDIVLMDMMMPEMDGYTTIEEIRRHYKFKKLPVLAVTAKAMSGDREKCIKAGASDYISKPVDIDQLLSLLRVWLYEK